MSKPIPVLNIADLAEGEMASGQVAGVDVVISLVDGRFYACENLCSHARQKLSSGRLRGFELQCPLHGARFDVRDGSCRTPPATVPIKTFPVTLEGGKVCVTILNHGSQRPPGPF